MYDTIDVPDLRREAHHRATALQRDADHTRLRAESRGGNRSRLGAALRRTLAHVDGTRRAF